MNRQDFINKTLQFEIEIEKISQKFYDECYLSEEDIKEIFPHGTKVRILPTRDSSYTRNSKDATTSDPNKIVGKTGKIDLTWNVYSERYTNVRFPADEYNSTSYQRLVPYYQLEFI